MRRIHSFIGFINEQETEKKDGNNKDSTTLDPKNIAQGMFDLAIQKLGFEDNNFTQISDTEETKGGLPVKSCGSTPYQFKPVESTNQEVMNLFKEPDGKFSKDIRYSEISKLVTNNENQIFLVGVRESLDVKKKEGDRFTDKLMMIDSSKPNDKVISYQITTSPSVAFYGDPKRALNKSGVAIMQPGVTQYKIGVHRKGSPTEHEALLQAGPMKINRFELNTTEINTYKPGKESTGDDYGINIHRSSKDRGICVGPYSAGCQVFSDGNDFSDFMNRIKAAAQNKGVFFYALIENDNFTETEEKSTNAQGDEDKTEVGEEDKVTTKKKSKITGGEVDIESGNSGEDSKASLERAAKKINKELDAFNSDEDLIIDTYNKAVTSDKLAKKMKDVYKDLYDKDIIDDIDGALTGSELKKLDYT
jgi:hypothetical protein